MSWVSVGPLPPAVSAKTPHLLFAWLLVQPASETSPPRSVSRCDAHLQMHIFNGSVPHSLE